MNPGRFLEMHSLRVEEYSLFKESGADYWHCSIIDAAGSTISGGFGFNKEMARKIAYAECLERFAYREIVKCGEREQERWGINLIPTACGFAAGFNEANTVIRSLSEAVERWVASKWIDDGYALTEIAEKDLVANLDPASAWFCKQFDEVLFFSKDVMLMYANQMCKFKIGLTVAVKDGGVFHGSSAQYEKGIVWQHALLESFRHLLAVKNNAPTNSFPDDRVRYFAENGTEAIEIIRKPKKLDWPLPQIGFHHFEHMEQKNFYLARTIIEGWKSWHLGPLNRFLY